MTPFRFKVFAFLLLSSFLHAAPILIDFGNAGTPTTGGSETYNNVTSSMGVGSLLSDLVDTSNTLTGISLSATNWFYGYNTNGVTSGGPYEGNATRDSMYDANSTWGNNSGDETVVLVFGGLDAGKTYDFTMYASRSGTGNRTTVYSFAGGNSGSTSLDVYGNVSDTATVSALTPDGSGNVTMTLTSGTNDSSQNFIYLGAMEINVIPEPSTITLVLGALGLMILFHRRR